MATAAAAVKPRKVVHNFIEFLCATVKIMPRPSSDSRKHIHVIQRPQPTLRVILLVKGKNEI
jgi:hypothetical protein